MLQYIRYLIEKLLIDNQDTKPLAFLEVEFNNFRCTVVDKYLENNINFVILELDSCGEKSYIRIHRTEEGKAVVNYCNPKIVQRTIYEVIEYK